MRAEPWSRTGRTLNGAGMHGTGRWKSRCKDCGHAICEQHSRRMTCEPRWMTTILSRTSAALARGTLASRGIAVIWRSSDAYSGLHEAASRGAHLPSRPKHHSPPRSRLARTRRGHCRRGSDLHLPVHATRSRSAQSLDALTAAALLVAGSAREFRKCQRNAITAPERTASISVESAITVARIIVPPL